jgi:hypothetical protein
VADTLSRAPGPPVANTWRCGKCGHRDESFLSPPCTEIWSVSLSQSAVAAVSAGVDFAALAGAQAASPEEMAACRTAITGLRLADIPFGQNKVTLLCDVSGPRPRPLVPIPFRRQIFDALHNLSHPAIRATKKIVSDKYVWHGMGHQVGKWAKECVDCQRAKVHRHVHSPVEAYDEPVRRFDHVNIDLVGPLPPSRGYTHLLTVVDRVTRWPEAIPLTATCTMDIAVAFLQGWLSRYGLPSDISSDRGAQFTSALWADLTTLLGTKLHHTTAYHPQANGLVERFHRRMKDSLKAKCQVSSWSIELAWTMLGIRTTLKEDLGTTSAELVFGEQLTVPGEFVGHGQGEPVPALLERLRQHVGDLRPIPPSRHGSAPVAVPTSLTAADYVFIRRGGHKNPLQPPYDGPFKVLSKSDKFFVVRVGLKDESVSVDRLKVAYLDRSEEVIVAQPPRRGRPRLQPSAPPPAVPVPRQALPTTTTRIGRKVQLPVRFRK